MFPRWPGRRTTKDGLIALRFAFLAFSLALVLFAFELAFIDDADGPVVPWLPMLAALAAFSIVATRVLISRPLDCSTEERLAQAYRTRFFVTIALSESVALLGFVFAFIGGPRWIYEAGGAFTLFRFWTVAPPTRAGIARDQERLSAIGCELSLVAALRGPAPPGPPPPPPVPPFPPPPSGP
jgi:F0F1-type ATP synthase membrane subunit c/vacuolar-type H+-ATPase subunit K